MNNVALNQHFFLATVAPRKLYFAVLTGCLRVSRDYNREESIFTGLNNPKIFSITTVGFDEYFGFTDMEVKEMLQYYGFPEAYDAVKAWYDGYRFGNVDVYCPWDVISYCDELEDDPELEPRDYWSNFKAGWYVKSNKESGDGYSDILIEIENENIGIVIEVKYAENAG